VLSAFLNKDEILGVMMKKSSTGLKQLETDLFPGDMFAEPKNNCSELGQRFLFLWLYRKLYKMYCNVFFGAFMMAHT